jgi:diguanylate cyclase (GGDEF)-like protein
MRGSDEISTVADSIDSMLNQLQESHSDLAYLASHDSLTRLYNRRRFEAELKSLLFREPGSGAVLWIDLDHFKDVNDSLGHAAGDQLLIHVANLLSKHLRDQSIVARLGGDEFGILLPGADAEQAIGAANRILNLFSQGLFAVATHDVRMSASVGVAVFPDDGTLVDDLLAHADLAMYEAKSKGRNALALFTSESEMQSGMTERILMAEQILRALRENRFQLYAQPLRRTSDASTNDYELLLRMVLEDGTIVMPDRIIPTAERIGLIRDIDRWVVRRGIEMIAEETALGRDTRFSVNVSGTAFSDPELLDIVRDEIDAHGIEPDRLIIEITETTAIADIEHAKAFIEELKDVGCRFALDDFGAGSSSFFYLKHLAVDFLKIDGGLVRNLCGDTTDKYFVRAIVEMCKGLGIPTVAEFVETDELYHLVRELGIDYAQGYGVGRPQPPGMYLAPFDDSSSLAVDTPASLNAEKVLDPDVT